MRRIFCFLISILLLLSFAGCTFLPVEWGNSDQKTTVSSGPSSGKTETDTNTDQTTLSDPATDDPSSDQTTVRDVLKIPISQLRKDEQSVLADYLFQHYIPCSFGLFTDAKTLSSPSVWSSVEALNRSVDGDESEASRKLENVLKKVEIYYPDTEFFPEKVRVYDAATKTFAPSPANTRQYEMLSYEVKGDEISIYYKDKPEGDTAGEEIQQYVTTLKNSPTQGYFAFVSSVKSESVG